MPKRYEAIRDSLVTKGTPYDKAQERAAKIYNATRKPGQKPVTGKAHK